MDDDTVWYWGMDQPNNNRLVLIDVVIEVYKKKSSPEIYQYLKNNIDNLNQELHNLSKFFAEIIKIGYKKISDKRKIKQIKQLKDGMGNTFIDDKLALILLNFSKQIISNTSLKTSKNLMHGGSSLLLGELNRFPEINKQEEENFKNKVDNLFSDNNMPELVPSLIQNEFKLPLNINDIILIGFSVLPNIGWIFDILMIFRALLEKRYVYAILVSINCYQYLFFKLMSFGILGIDLGPIIKFFYVAPYLNEYFTYDNFMAKISDIIRSINFPQAGQILIK